MQLLRSISPVLVLAAIVAPTAFGAQDEILPGTYDGKGDDVKATVLVEESGDAELRYSMNTDCGREKGSVTLDETASGALKGGESSRDTSVVARLKPDTEGARMSGSIRLVKEEENKRGDVSICRAKRTFEAVLDPVSSPAVKALAGHYAGSGDDAGRPVSFDVAFNPKNGSLRVANFAIESDTECWEDLDDDGSDDTLVVRLSGLGGVIEPDGSFELDDPQDDDTSVYVEGSIVDGTAVIDVELGGLFAADGTPASGGAYDCESWGEIYRAYRG